MTELSGTFKELEEKQFSDNHCFLCGAALHEENRTEEHVIPKWLQNRLNLWDQKLTLLNNTLIPYRQLTIPCCFNCNNTHLEPFESEISKAYDEGFTSFANLDRRTLFLWLAKIYYGLIYKEMFLQHDRSDPASEMITSPEYLESFHSHLLFLQAFRKNVQFNDFFPASIFIFETQQVDDVGLNWDLVDNHMSMFIAIRMGPIGIVSALQDGQACQHLDEILDDHKDIELHPLQFTEITSRVLCKSLLMNRTPKYISAQDGSDEISIIQMPLQGLSGKPIFDDWNDDLYVDIFSTLSAAPKDTIRPKDAGGRIATWLQDENNKSIFIDAKKYSALHGINKKPNHRIHFIAGSARSE